MIPITVSFFLNQRGGILQAAVFLQSIVVLFHAPDQRHRRHEAI